MSKPKDAKNRIIKVELCYCTEELASKVSDLLNNALIITTLEGGEIVLTASHNFIIRADDIEAVRSMTHEERERMRIEAKIRQKRQELSALEDSLASL